MRNATRRFHVQPGGTPKKIGGSLGGECPKGYEFSDQYHQNRQRALQRRFLNEGLADLGGDEHDDGSCLDDEQSMQVELGSLVAPVQHDTATAEMDWETRFDRPNHAAPRTLPVIELEPDRMDGWCPTSSSDNEHLDADVADAVKVSWLSGADSVYPNGNPWDDGDYHSLREMLDSGEWPLHVDFLGPLQNMPDDDEELLYASHFDGPEEDPAWEEHSYVIWAHLWHESHARHRATKQTHRDRQFVELHGRLKRVRGRFSCDRDSEPYDSTTWASHRSRMERACLKVVAADVAEGLLERKRSQDADRGAAESPSFVSKEVSVELPHNGAATVSTGRRVYIKMHTYDGRLTCAHAGQRPRRRPQR